MPASQVFAVVRPQGKLSSGNELKQKNDCEKPQSSEITDQGAYEGTAATEGGRE